MLDRTKFAYCKSRSSKNRDMSVSKSGVYNSSFMTLQCHLCFFLFFVLNCLSPSISSFHRKHFLSRVFTLWFRTCNGRLKQLVLAPYHYPPFFTILELQTNSDKNNTRLSSLEISVIVVGFFPSEIKIQNICDALFKIRSCLIFQFERRLFGRKKCTVSAYSVTVASQSIRYVSFVVCFFLLFL